jgi:hypothetical protein
MNSSACKMLGRTESLPEIRNDLLQSIVASKRSFAGQEDLPVVKIIFRRCF